MLSFSSFHVSDSALDRGYSENLFKDIITTAWDKVKRDKMEYISVSKGGKPVFVIQFFQDCFTGGHCSFCVNMADNRYYVASGSIFEFDLSNVVEEIEIHEVHIFPLS